MNLRYGLFQNGRFIYAGTAGIAGSSGGGDLPDDKINYLPDVFTVIAYNDDGTKTAIFGAGSESNSLKQLTFEVVETGCGKVELTFNKLPVNTELSYKQRIDIHLFNDSRPWYSGYILQRPIEGTTATDSFKFTGHGYYNLLEKIIINKTYEKMEVSAIVLDIAKDIEKKVGLVLNKDKIISTDYTITKIELDHVTAKEALNQLSDFAIDYVYGIDEYRQLYFKPRIADINEQARLWVGQHLTKYEPTWNIEDIVNHAYIKGGNIDDEGEQWLAEVEDLESQELYKVQEDILTLPSAYSVEDAERWGESQLVNLAKPKKSAKVSGVKLEYPRADGTFFVRKLSTQGQAVITTLDGELFTYPISKLKYTVSSDKGIQLDMELGEIPDAIDRYFANLDRDAKMAELLQQAATKQLKTGG
nr:MAG TPA: tail protein [Caudoviricetes sp.]